MDNLLFVCAIMTILQLLADYKISNIHRNKTACYTY